MAEARPTPSRRFDPGTRGRITAVEDLILARLDDDKAQDVVFIDLKGKSPVADGLIVAIGRRSGMSAPWPTTCCAR
jgi:ribosome-associated protein